jgi:hypothetical protein
MATVEGGDLWPELGGPMCRTERALRLVRGRPGDVYRVVLVLVAVAWVPFILLALAEWVRSGSPDPLFRDGTVHVRLLVTLPLLVAAEWAVSGRCAADVARVLEDGFVVGAERDRARRLVQRAQRLRDSALAEALLLSFVALVAVGSLMGRIPSALGVVEASNRMTAAGVYHTLVSRPIVQFLMLRQIWRWLVWDGLLYAFSRLDLRLLATHPDRGCGLRFLARPSVNFGFFLAAISSMLSAHWAMRLAAGGVHLNAFLPELFTFVGAGVILAFAPLLVFVPKLIRAKRDAAHTYGRLALDYIDQFDRRWIHPGRDENVLGTSDIQSLADLGNSYRFVDETVPIPFHWKDVTAVALSMIVPILPLYLFEVPVDQLLKKVAGTVFSLPI